MSGMLESMRFTHKISAQRGPRCGRFKIGDGTSGSWKKVDCPQCRATEFTATGTRVGRMKQWKAKKEREREDADD